MIAPVTTRKHKMDSTLFDLDLLLPTSPMTPKTKRSSYSSIVPKSKKQKTLYITDDCCIRSNSAPPPQLPSLDDSDDDDDDASIVDINLKIITPRLNNDWTEEAPPLLPYLIDDDDWIIKDNEKENRKPLSFLLQPRFYHKESILF